MQDSWLSRTATSGCVRKFVSGQLSQTVGSDRQRPQDHGHQICEVAERAGSRDGVELSGLVWIGVKGHVGVETAAWGRDSPAAEAARVESVRVK